MKTSAVATNAESRDGEVRNRTEMGLFDNKSTVETQSRFGHRTLKSKGKPTRVRPQTANNVSSKMRDDKSLISKKPLSYYDLKRVSRQLETTAYKQKKGMYTGDPMLSSIEKAEIE